MFAWLHSHLACQETVHRAAAVNGLNGSGRALLDEYCSQAFLLSMIVEKLPRQDVVACTVRWGSLAYAIPS